MGMRKLLKEKKGMTLAELMVSLVLLGILGTLCLAALGTYTENYNHINSLNRAHDVSDSLLKSIQKQVGNADKIIWLDPSAGVTAGTSDGGDALCFQMGGYPAYVKLTGSGAADKWISIRYDNAVYIAEGGKKISDRELAPSQDASFGFHVEELKFEKVPASNGYGKADQLVKATLTLKNEMGIAYTASRVMECMGNARGLYGNAGETGAEASSIMVEKRLHTAGGAVYLGGMVKTGQELIYEITVRNEGSAQATVLLEELPGFSLSETSPFILPAGGTKTVNAIHTVGAGENSVTNIVTAHVQAEDGTVLADVTGQYGPVLVESSGFTVEKRIVQVNGVPVTQNPAKVKNGELITYELLVKNNGNKDLKNLAVQDVLTVEGTPVSLTSGPSGYVIPRLEANGENKRTVTYRVAGGISGELRNTVTAYLQEKPGDKKTASVSTTIDSGFNFEVKKRLHDYEVKDKAGKITRYEYGSERIVQNPGDELTLNYYIEVKNTGNEPLNVQLVEDNLFVNDSENSVPVSAKVLDGSGEIPAGESRIFRATYVSDGAIPNSLRNVATVTAEGVPESRKDECVTLFKDVEGLQIEKRILAENGESVTKLDDVQIGTRIVFPVSIQNTGNTTLTIGTLRDLMEIGGATAAAGDVPQFSEDKSGKVPLQVPFTIEKGASKHFYAAYTLKDKDGGKKITNRVQAQTAMNMTGLSNTVSLTVKVMPPVVGDATWPSDADFAEHDKESGGGSSCWFNQGNIVSWIKDGVKYYYIGAYPYLTGIRINKGMTPESFPDGYYVRIDRNLGEVQSGQAVTLQRGDIFQYKGTYYVYASKLQPDWAPSGVIPDNWNPEKLDTTGNNQYAVKVDLLTEQHWTT